MSRMENTVHVLLGVHVGKTYYRRFSVGRGQIGDANPLTQNYLESGQSLFGRTHTELYASVSQHELLRSGLAAANAVL